MNKLLAGGLCASFLAFVPIGAQAQCIANSEFGSTTITACDGQPQTMTLCAAAGEYSTASGIQAGNSYTFTSSGGSGNNLTIQDSVNTATVLGFGDSPVTVIPTTNNALRANVFASGFPTCGTEQVCRTVTVSCTPGAPSIIEIPTLSGIGLAALITLMVGAGVFLSRRRARSGNR